MSTGYICFKMELSFENTKCGWYFMNDLPWSLSLRYIFIEFLISEMMPSCNAYFQSQDSNVFNRTNAMFKKFFFFVSLPAF